MDRHKKTEARTKDRHKPGYIRPSRRNPNNPEEKRAIGRPRTKTPKEPKPPKAKKEPKKPWNGRFVSVDGEGWNGRYNLLACSAIDYDLYSSRGLSTEACLEYLSGWQIKPGDALVGFGLSYDFENLLRDIPDDDYIKLLNNEEIKFKHFIIKNYIPRKFLEVQRILEKVDEEGKPRKKTIFLQCTLGFFQTSFIGALKKFNIEIPEIITKGKEMRGDFSSKDLPFIKEYNREELRLLNELMDKLRTAGKEAFESIGLKPNFTPRTWFGPGAWASNFLRQTHWNDEHPAFTGPVFDQLQAEIKDYLNLPEFQDNDEKNELNELILEIEKNKKLIIKDKLKIINLCYPNLFDEIKSLGGIAPTLFTWNGEYLQSIPRQLKRKKGKPLDQLADELGYTVRDLLDAIAKGGPKKTPEELRQEAQKVAYQDPEYVHLEELQHKLQKEWALLDDQIPDKENLKDIADLTEFPFAAAFYGGRIECAAVGEFNQPVRDPLRDYDINSAYPFAISNLPWWDAEDLRYVEGFDHKNRIGMYLVEWKCPPGCNFYPFPFRSKTGNVFYPREGKGWYMDPEVNAAREVWGDAVHVLHGYVLKDTDGAGDGLTKLPEHKLCTTAKKIDEMAKVRLKAKAEKLSYEKALKLVMNSVYGKLIQQVGSHKFLNPFAASWITCTCRAIISRTIGQDKENSIISIMTDGILSRKELPVNIGTNLGEFELKTFDQAIQFMPGVYFLGDTENPDKNESKYRGMGKNFNPQEAKYILWEDYYEEKIKGNGETKLKKHGTYQTEINCFVTRNLGLHQREKFYEKRFQFVPVIKEEEFSLRSKRQPGKKGFRLYKKDKYSFFPPKDVNPMELMLNRGSRPYKLDLPAEMDYDKATTLEEMTSEEAINTLFEIDNYDLRG